MADRTDILVYAHWKDIRGLQNSLPEMILLIKEHGNTCLTGWLLMQVLQWQTAVLKK